MSIYDDLIKHKILINKYSKSQARSYLADLKEIKKAVKYHIEKSGVTSSKSLKESLKNGVEAITKAQINKLQTFYDYEQKFAVKLFNKHSDQEVLNTLSVTRKDISALDVPFSLFKAPVSVEDAYTSYTNKVIDKTFRLVSDAEVNGTSKTDLLASINDLYNGLVKTQSDSLALNLINGVSGMVREDIINDNPQLDMNQVTWVSVLDSTTCSYCEDLDGQVFDIDDAPDWPAHVNCNCELVPTNDN